MSVGKKSILVILAVLIIDQILKIWIKTHFALGESVEITSWFHITFTENSGMAFGMELFNKLFLTLFRIIAVSAIAYFIYRFIKQKKYSDGFIICISLIFAGATGNIIDSVFYGVIFDYAPLLYGRVVDMLHFPIFTFPEWIPFLGGHIFFEPVFNIADSVIMVAVFYILIFYRKYLGDNKEKKNA